MRSTSRCATASPCLPPQVHPVVSRLCAPIEGTDGAHIADCLGLDPARFRGGGGAAGGSSGGGASDEYAGCASALDDEANFVVRGQRRRGGERGREEGRDGGRGHTRLTTACIFQRAYQGNVFGASNWSGPATRYPYPPHPNKHAPPPPSQGLEPLQLQASASAGGSAFPFLGISEAMLGRVSPESLLRPPDCAGDASVQLSAAQLANQVGAGTGPGCRSVGLARGCAPT